MKEMKETVPLYISSFERSAPKSLNVFFVLAFFLVGMSYIDLPEIHLMGEVDIGIETIIFFLLLPVVCLTFFMRRIGLTREYLLISFLPVVAFFYVILGFIQGDNNPHRVLFEYKPFMFYFSFLFPVILIRRLNEAEFILRGIVFMTILYLPFLLLQYYMASEEMYFIAGKTVEMSWIVGDVRFVPKAGVVVLLVSFYLLWKNLHHVKLFNLLILAAFIMALTLTYTRNLWVSFMIGGLIICWYGKREIFRRLPVIVVAVVLGFMAIFLLFQDTVLGQRIMVRAGMISANAINVDMSLIWRVYETDMAIKAIKEAPIIGSGLGYRYHNQQNFADAGYYIHNNYLYIWMKMGVIGLIALAVFIYEFLRTGLYVYRAYKDNPVVSGIAISSVAYMITMIPAGIVQPRLSQDVMSIILISILYGILLRLKLLHDNK